MNCTIVGAGNIGTQFAAHCAEKGHEVILYTSRPLEIEKELSVVDENGTLLHKGIVKGGTDNPREAFADAELIFITLPAFCMSSISEKIEPYASSKMTICIVPGTGGGECAFKKCIEKGATACGLQRVPSVARLVKYGKTVRATGYRDELFVAALPASEAERCAEVIGSIFDMKCSAMSNYLNLTLTPSNPILHTTRLQNLFRDYKTGVVYDRISLFYEEWNDETSRQLCLCDEEVQEICRCLSPLDLHYVKSLRVHYESPTPEALTRKISSIAGFKGLTSPMISVEGGYIPDLKSRYFTADFPYGLSILVQIAEMLGLPAVAMKETLDWYRVIAEEHEEFRFSDYGIETKEELIQFYSL